MILRRIDSIPGLILLGSFMILSGIVITMQSDQRDPEPLYRIDSGETFLILNCGNHVDLYHRIVSKDSVFQYIEHYPSLIDFKPDGLIRWGKVVVNKELHPRYCDCAEFHILTNELKTLDKYAERYHLPGDAIRKVCATIWEEL